MTGEGADVVEVLRRWEDAGAYRRVISRRGGAVTVGLYRCDGGEEVDRFTSADSDLLRFLGRRQSSID
jgi:hypothetical protein